MNQILAIPEIRALDDSPLLIRIPNQMDIPVTSRVLRLIDTPVFQRLKHISQLGLVSQVYPAANHSRFEHSLGVYRNCLLFLRHLSWDERFQASVSDSDAQTLLLAALFHDVGHWPFCHPIEDMGLEGLPRHEALAKEWLADPSVQQCIEEDWDTTVDRVVSIINKQGQSKTDQLLASILSGPIDIDKLDYLYRDSLHAGVPYGQNFDTLRLIRSLCLNKNGDRLAIDRKGRTAAELMVFARYVMFSEVYWHHAVRGATAMLQRAFYRSHVSGASIDWMPEFRKGESEFVAAWRQRASSAGDESVSQILEGLFGPTRRLYKRAASFSFTENETLYRALAHQPYTSLVEIGEKLASQMSGSLGPDDILIDAPPVKLEVQFNVDVQDTRDQSWCSLGEVSPVVETLARTQFDDYVKQVRIFVRRDISLDRKSFDWVHALESAI